MDVFAHAGALGYLAMVGALVGLLASAGLAALGFSKRRVPLTGAVVVPYLILAAGAFAGWLALNLVTVSAATPSEIPIVAMAGVWNALTDDWLARWSAAVALAGGAWAAAVGAALMPGSEPRLTLVAAAGAGITTGVGAILVWVLAAYYGLGGGAYFLGLLLVVAGSGVAFAATRRAADDDMFRVAGLRFVSSMSMLFCVYHSVRAVDIGNRISAFAADGAILNETDLIKAIELFSAAVDPGVTISLVALFVAVVVAFFGFFAEIGEVVVRYTVFDMFGVVALMLFLGFLRLIESSSFNSMYSLATNFPAVEMYQDLGADLAAASVSRGEAVGIVRLADGGFGDLLAYEQDKWVRKFRWNGWTWREDGTDLAEVDDLSTLPPLLAVERGLEAEKIVDVLSRSGGRGFLMLRASEVKAGTFVPPEIARLQVTFLPIQMSQGRDLKTQLWLAAGSPEVNWGPTTWYGEHDDSLDTVKYANAALTATSSPGLNILIPGRKIGDIINSCMPYLLKDSDVQPTPDAAPAPAPEGAEGEEGEAPPPAAPKMEMVPDRWCALSTDDFDAVRTEAAGLWDMPVPTNVKLTVGSQGVAFDMKEVDDRVRRELGGIGYCAEKLATAGTPLKGPMTLQLAISKDGQVYDTLVDENSVVQSPELKACAAKRFRKLSFTMPDPSAAPPPPPPAPKKGKKGRGPQPPPGPVAPRVLVNLEFI
jgi:hypothetical protein